MYKYWEGYMDWPLNKDWKCEFCGQRLLMWGLIHAQCRCTTCHVHYRMRDKEDKIVDIPICQLKPEYCTTFNEFYNKEKVPINEITDEKWDEIFEEKCHVVSKR